MSPSDEPVMHSVQSPAQNDFLNTARKERKSVEVYLVNGIKLVGAIESFDRFVVVLSASGGMQAIYKSAISTIQFQGPARQSGSRMRAGRDEARDKEAEAPRVVTRKRRLPTTGS